ncbi:MAG: carbonic anhydrase [Acidobacteriota bacterium]|nr:carbonic anhydrase [Acidobacteriota bacterium]
MTEKKLGRRELCKGFLALGGAALVGGATAAEGQTTQPTPSPKTLDPLLQDQRIADAVKRGATMEEIAKLREPLARNPQEAIRALKTGNARFFSGAAQRPELSAAERRAQILGQTPFAVVLSCSDSRVPTEIVFDQGLGSLFITRVAGNVIDRATLGSIEYGVGHLKTHVVVVMGHEGCGAVKAAFLPPEARARETENIQFLLNQIAPAIARTPKIRDEKAKMREAVIANVRQQVQNLKQVKFIQEAVASGRIAVIGAFYEITSGAVDFLETDEDLRIGAEGGDNQAKWRAHLA